MRKPDPLWSIAYTLDFGLILALFETGHPVWGWVLVVAIVVAAVARGMGLHP